jgi:hypothetical protein
VSRLQARRIALAAQGFNDRAIQPGTRALDRVSARLGLFQIDSVNVFARAHYLPLYSRLGPYDPTLLDRAFNRAPRRLFEYWAHEASLVRVDLQPALRHRMARAASKAWGGPLRVAKERPDLVARVRTEVGDRGPVTARELDAALELQERRDRSDWGWNWSVVKQALEFLFYAGKVTSAGRNSAFERRYDLPERVLPASVIAAATPEPADAVRMLVLHAASALGVATEPALRDYFRLEPVESQMAVRELVEGGELLPVTVQGWRLPAYLSTAARTPRRVAACTLLSPFDPLVFERKRTEDLFGFRYRLEIYVPEPQRVYGYYVLPFLLGDQLVARVDLKGDRATGRLLVRAAHAEPHAPAETAARLAAELRRAADWQRLSDVVVEPRGALAPALASAVASDGAGW